MLRLLRSLGADELTRTADLLITNQLLYQLSYVGLKKILWQVRGVSQRDKLGGRAPCALFRSVSVLRYQNVLETANLPRQEMPVGVEQELRARPPTLRLPRPGPQTNR